MNCLRFCLLNHPHQTLRFTTKPSPPKEPNPNQTPKHKFFLLTINKLRKKIQFSLLKIWFVLF